MVAFGRTSVTYPCALASVVEEPVVWVFARTGSRESLGMMTKFAVYAEVSGFVDVKCSML